MDNKKSLIKKSYNQFASKYASKFDEMGARESDIIQALSYVDKKNPFVFEIGCGNGRDAEAIMRYTNNYMGMDVSEELVRLAKEKVPQGRFEVEDFGDYVFPKNVDVIFAFASLLHADKNTFSEVLKKASEVLNPGGVFYISLKYGDYVEKRQEDEFGVRYFYYYTPELVKELAGNQFDCLSEQVHELRGQKWTEVVLKKK